MKMRLFPILLVFAAAMALTFAAAVFAKNAPAPGDCCDFMCPPNTIPVMIGGELGQDLQCHGTSWFSECSTHELCQAVRP